MFSKNDPRPKYNVKVLTELYDKENKSLHIYDVFTPNPKMIPLTGKFYAYHDMADLSTADQKLMDIIKDYKDRRPDQKYPKPILESHQIGWHNAPLVPIRKNDRRFYAPRVRTISTFITPVKTKQKP